MRRLDADVLFAPGYSAPLRSPIPTVVAIYDVSFCAHPEWFSWREGARRRTLTRLAAARAAGVVTISRFSQREIAAHLGVDAARVAVFYPGVPHVAGLNGDHGRHAADVSIERDIDHDAGRTAGGSGKMVLFVGSVFQRRHVDVLIRGCAAFAASGELVTLEIVGGNRTSPHLDLEAIARDCGIADRVRVRDYVADDELRRLYRTGGRLCLPVRIRGFRFHAARSDARRGAADCARHGSLARGVW